jgi:hypothetical protein
MTAGLVNLAPLQIPRHLYSKFTPERLLRPRYLPSRQFARKNSDWITSRTSVTGASGVDLQF